MRTTKVHLPAFPGHRIRRKGGGNKFHAIPISHEEWRHRCSRLCECRPVPVGPVDGYGHGLWMHIDRPRDYKWMRP
jgi:hypothetical protein